MIRKRVRVNKEELAGVCRSRGITSWAELSKLAGISASTLPHAFHQNDGVISLEVAFLISRALDVNIDEFGEEFAKDIVNSRDFM